MTDLVPVTHGITSKDRPDLLARSLRSLNKQTRLPEAVVVVDCSENAPATRAVVDAFRRSTPIPRVVYEFRDPSGWSRGKGRNLCCALAKTPLITSTETDILFDNALYELAAGMFGEPPYRRIHAYPLIVKLRSDGQPLFAPQDAPRIGYFQMFRREDFDGVGGYNPFLVDWGHEDSDFIDRMTAAGVKRERIHAVATHMWHAPAYRSIAEKTRQFERNVHISRKTKWNGESWV
ncbi:MAG: glycosyltransferase [Vicinamibacteria bacterium]|nr:glycosyltransferase [Vicinamibacteria bacterium]